VKHALDMALGFPTTPRWKTSQGRCTCCGRRAARTGEEPSARHRQVAMRSLLGRDQTLHLAARFRRGGEPFPVLLDAAEAWGGGHWAGRARPGRGSVPGRWHCGFTTRQRFGGLVVVDLKGELANCCGRMSCRASLPSRSARSRSGAFGSPRRSPYSRHSIRRCARVPGARSRSWSFDSGAGARGCPARLDGPSVEI